MDQRPGALACFGDPQELGVAVVYRARDRVEEGEECRWRIWRRGHCTGMEEVSQGGTYWDNEDMIRGFVAGLGLRRRRLGRKGITVVVWLSW